ncbi:histidine--tRNA ligase [Acaryochloris marina]|uniref:Histidine--tRNA ligase n=1 Tax=Acaryochloris marina (strain MBIC 11017) TaxID=329726 RepID=SYH_ACAM1|nr:histidine--tRNA ligase [Acaryochloris marina]B0CDA0.1 RecName: Full=Histidine--tRNA ligase; AltName: Full=Histidyl-tRNA synthetase; Short=HisRS [Acaryochloris marina MBIC11017]ABW25691.1 histidyl-tRNA synthetase [Acaryochloris marina MBIC11017]BDM80564.1 histidine--tRNA ligase [Acaryochloris marina MBIC10699]
MGFIQVSRGTRDILPDEVIYWQYVEATARQLLHQAAYRELRTPIFEQTNLFERGIGEATDVVGKEMYTFQDRGDRSITLRPEGTAGAVRSFIENKLHAQGGVQRLWYIGPMFRYERPGAGRQRQFHQIGVEALGSQDPRADAEVIAIASQLLKSLGVPDWTLSLNSLGTAEDRQKYREALVTYLSQYKDDLDPDSQDRLQRNPLRILDSKDPKTKEIAQSAPNILDYLGTDSKQHFDRVQQLLTDLDIAYKLNPCLVRGLDYYTHTAFEFELEGLGNQATVCGGGRYDRLVSELGGPETPAVGWAIGMERLILLLQNAEITLNQSLDFYCVARGPEAEAQALLICQNLRENGFSVEMDLSGSAFGKQLKRANRSGALACLILGDTEACDRTVQLKWLASGEQESIAQADLRNLTSQLQSKLTAAKGNSST